MNDARDAIGPFRGATDVAARFQLPSEIDRVQWIPPKQTPAAKARLDIRTRFVGNGAPVVVEAVDGAGRSVWRGSGTVANGACLVDVDLPASLSPGTVVVAMVRLPRHALEATAVLSVVDAIAVVRAGWDRDVARPGDGVNFVAEVDGARPSSAAVIRVMRVGADGIETPLETLAAVVAGHRIEASWLVPESEAIKPPCEVRLRITVDASPEVALSATLLIPAAPEA